MTNPNKTKGDQWNSHDEHLKKEATYPPPVDYPQRNRKGKWQVGEIELDSETDRDYINNMLEFREIIIGLSNQDQ